MMKMNAYVRAQKSAIHTLIGWAAALCACSAPTDETPQVGSTKSALVGGIVEPYPRTPGQQATVAVRDSDVKCSGHLVTPGLALTAAHCLWTHEGGAGGHVRASKVIATVGLRDGVHQEADFRPVADAWGAWIAIGAHPDAMARDLALVEIGDPDVLAPNVFEAFAGAESRRPSLVPFDPAAPMVVGTLWSACPDRACLDGVSFVAPRTITPIPYTTGPSAGYSVLFLDGKRPQLYPGDSGGTLALASSLSAVRIPVGVASGGDVTTNALGGYVPLNGNFADVTAPAAQAWLSKNAVVPMTSAWKRQHAWAKPDRWRGEVEYLGTCRQSEDQDCDHWIDAHDNCPVTFNPSQKDTDDDGVGDACVCPCDPSNAFGDADKDGVCAVACPGEPTDNCPTVANADQANSNLLAEQTLNLPIVGDACEPVPVPVAHTDEVTSTVRCTDFGFAAGKSCSGLEVRDVLDTTPLTGRSNKALGGSGYRDGEEANLGLCPEADIYRRFCQATDDASCAARPVLQPQLGDVLHPTTFFRDLTLRDYPASPLAPWGAIGAPQSTLTSNIRPPWAKTLADRSRDLRSQWNFVRDLTRWQGEGSLALDPSCVASGHTTCLSGALLTQSTVGCGSTGADFQTYDGGVHGDGLSAHYMPYAPDTWQSYMVAGRGFHLFPFFLWRTLPDPAPPYIVHWSPDTGLSGPPRDGGALSLAGSGLGVEMASSVRSLLLQRPTVAWSTDASAAVRPTKIAAPVFDGAASDPWVNAIMGQNSALTLATEGSPAYALQRPWNADAGVIPTRTAPLATWSATRATMVYGGGTANGAPLTDVYVRRAPTATEPTFWRPLGLTLPRGAVLDALVLEPTSNTVFVASRTRGQASVDAVSLETGRVRSIFSAPRGNNTERLDLSLGPAGTVYVVALGTRSAQLTELTPQLKNGVYSRWDVTRRYTSPVAWLRAPVSVGGALLTFQGDPRTDVLRDEVTLNRPTWTAVRPSHGRNDHDRGRGHGRGHGDHDEDDEEDDDREDDTPCSAQGVFP